MTEGLAVVRAVGRRTWLKVLRRPVVLTFSLVQPLMWMAFFGFLMQRYPLDGLPDGVGYLSFVLPGICAMTVLFGASQSGIPLIRDLQTGFLRRMLATPAGRTSMHLGKLQADVLRLLLQAVVVLVLGTLIGARLSVDADGLAPALATLALFAAAFASLSCLIALKARAPETMGAFVHIVNMPIFFTSTALVPDKNMPGWLAVIARNNPLTLAVDQLRGALLGVERPPAGPALAVLGALAVLLFVLAAREMSRVAQD